MSLSFRFGAGLAVAAGFLSLAGCFNDEVDALGTEGAYDKRALDMYLTDVQPPIVQVKAEPKVDVEVSTPTAYKDFYGEWEAKMDPEAMKAEMEKERAKRAAEDPNYDPEAEKMGEAFAMGMAEMFQFALNIKEDKTFELTMMFMPITGRWEQKGNQIWLYMEGMLGMTKEDIRAMGEEQGDDTAAMDEPMKLKISPDGTTLTVVDSAGDENAAELVFRRKGA